MEYSQDAQCVALIKHISEQDTERWGVRTKKGYKGHITSGI